MHWLTYLNALTLLNRLQAATGGAVEAYEYMPGTYIAAYLEKFPNARAPFDQSYGVTVLVEVGATAPRDAVMGDDGETAVTGLLQAELVAMMEAGQVLDAVVAQNEAQRREMWERREAAAEVALSSGVIVNNDIAVPPDRVAQFLAQADAALALIDPEAKTLIVSHLGDGNVHYTVQASPIGAKRQVEIVEAIEGIVADLGGSFSAEHGIGLTKIGSMSRRKDPVALEVMRSIKAALDPGHLMNPGKGIPAG